MASRFIVIDNGAQSTVIDEITGKVVFTGPYERAVSQAAELNRQASAFYNQKTTVVSSGTVIKDDQAARADMANPVDPPTGQLISKNGRIQTAPDTTTSSNAERTDTFIADSGLSSPTKTLTETQSTPAGGPGVTYRVPGYDSVDEDAFIGGNFTGINFAGSNPTPNGTSRGRGAPSDDITSTNIVSSLNAIDWTDKIVPEPNVLDQYTSYTYQASLYLCDKKNADRILNTGTKNLTGAKLLIQSGGASSGDGRNDFFGLDYYIDKIELHSFFAGKAVRLAHNVKEVRMTIIEPNGMSFVQNLDAAVQQFAGSVEGKQKNFTSQIYMLVLRFYGYDAQGNLVRGGNPNNQAGNQTSDPNAFVEKFYPLIITKLGFRIANKAVEYEIQAKAPPYYINASSGRGTLPFNFEFSGQTLKDILAGPAVYASNQNAVTAGSNAPKTTAPTTSYEVEYQTGPGGEIVPTFVETQIPATTKAPAKATAITPNKKTVRQGLMDALNSYQKELKNKGVIQFADEYNIEFAIDSMASASIILPGLNKSATSMSTPGTAADQKLVTKQSMDPASQSLSATAGMQIVQFIDNLVKNSSYIRDQQLLVINAKTGKEETGPGINLKNTAWYRIGFKAIPKLDEYDELRNDYAYKITYTISPYKISNLNTPYFKAPVFNGVHKSYKYWFTGQNTAVLSYEESLNSLYYLVLTNSNLSGATSSSNIATQYVNELLKYGPGTASGQSTQGAKGRTLEPSSNASDQLYSPSDLKECHMTIVGDPAWLQQGESFVALNKKDPYYFKAFLQDGTINFDSQQILFEIGFNAPRDYNLATGLMQPSADKLNSTTQLTQVTQTPGSSQFSRIYITKECISNFDKGKFTQTLKGSLMVYYPPGKTEGRLPPQNLRTTKASVAASPAVTKTPAYTPPRSSVTDPNPTSALAKGTQQILNPVTNGENLPDSTLRTTPIYIQARKGGATDAAALAAARSASAAGTNNYSGTALPGIRVPNQQIVKDQ